MNEGRPGGRSPASMLKSRRVPRDAVIVRRGDAGESMFFIARGEVEVLVPSGPVTLQEGDFFGEMAVIGRTARTATVIARRSCDLLVLDAADLLKLTEGNAHVQAGLDAAIAARPCPRRVGSEGRHQGPTSAMARPRPPVAP